MFLVMFDVMFDVNISRLRKRLNFVNVNGVTVDKRTLYFRRLWDSGVGGCYI